ncbi:uncharacterized protein EV422DRAFT_523516 [Fimicolochytrium jonesii]|uniref:uncharacterized protein n=1 Tax=Fimicolochytrium jonesii TaxID=1396493 RepID=UPI0022FE3B07|nr:uncharacterized protein EV422DRAFT_523516 [Fimicolochytrium jonesii]KAI8823136.1 hypothetical protein EV422DRAFT_523516 [Fimicolochytrium jonesii]
MSNGGPPPPSTALGDLRLLDPTQLLSFLSTSVASPQCSFHHFFKINPDSRTVLLADPTQEELSRWFVCKDCFTHLDILPSPVASDPDGKCIIHGAPFHHYHVVKVTRRGGGGINDTTTTSEAEYTAECCQCHRPIEFTIRPPVIPVATLRYYATRETQMQRNALRMWSRYLRDMVVSGTQRRPVNAQNKNFAAWIGVDEHSRSVFGQMGYAYDREEGQFIPVNAADRTKTLLALQEIQFQRWKKEGNPGLDDDWPQYFSAVPLITKYLGAKVQGEMGSDMVAYLKSLSADDLAQHYNVLGTTRDATDSNIRWLYDLLTAHDPSRMTIYLDAVAQLAQARNSNDLQELVAIERSKGAPLLGEVEAAYATIGMGVSPETTDDMLISAFATAISDRPDREIEYREALRTIAFIRDSGVLQHFLETGEVYESMDGVTRAEEALLPDVKDTTKPAGLENIGNTCYLNSLLQLLFTVRELRDAIFTVEPPVPMEIDSPLPADGTNLEASVSSLSSDPETRKEEHGKKAREFLRLLQNLFSSLIWSDRLSIAPPRELARIALNSQNLAGGQQDISESMDNIMGLLETVLLENDKENCIKSLLFGKTLQTLSYKDKDGKPCTSNKNEEFSHLIIEVADNLYTSLDSYFDVAKVDIENTEAERELSITDAPPILMFQIRRAKFDREKKTAYKLNDYMRYDSTIFLDAYMTANVESSRERRRKLGEVRAALGKLVEQRNAATEPQSLYPLSEQASETELVQELSLLEAGAESKQLGYTLHAVFVHLGEASYGHYYIYLRDEPQNRWLKFNDADVTEVPESQVFSDTTGSTANAYALIYIRAKDASNLVNTYTRTPAIREYYMEHFTALSYAALEREKEKDDAYERLKAGREEAARVKAEGAAVMGEAGSPARNNP